MKKFAAVAATLFVAACAEPPLPSEPVSFVGDKLMSASANAEVIRDHYIVVFKSDVSDVPGATADIGRAAGISARYTYTAALRGFAAYIPAAALARVANDPRVKYVEPDGVVRVIQTIPWGIIKVGADVSSTKAGDGTGAVTNVNSYVIDTGIDVKHRDLNAVWAVNTVGGPNSDCHGHGTHVAGTVGARDNTVDVVGVAPGLKQYAVKVLNCAGSGSWSSVIAGIDWVTKNHVKPAVANMSLGGGANQSVDDAVRNSAAAGVFYAVAAGNDGADACNYSPARAGAGTNNGIMTVAATDSNDQEASWSNFGSCVDIWAPGVSILSTRAKGGTTTMSGTSMASPHVAGGGALYLSSNTAASPTTVEGALKAAAQTPGTTSKDGRSILREYVGTF